MSLNQLSKSELLAGKEKQQYQWLTRVINWPMCPFLQESLCYPFSIRRPSLPGKDSSVRRAIESSQVRACAVNAAGLLGNDTCSQYGPADCAYSSQETSS